eukprot:GHVN01062714.1.p1 GENE.GHVN01062714.1~~GHVN01062714.1.p1  ORF type:complete len:304 (-),score=29.85 GHVN01062714.1:508-1419(-)
MSFVTDEQWHHPQQSVHSDDKGYDEGLDEHHCEGRYNQSLDEGRLAEYDGQDNNEEDVGDYVEEDVETFDLLNLSDDLLRGIYAYGFERPSTIQMRGIKPILEGHDTIGQAQSGTGKTATFVIACLQKINYSRLTCQALILAPTRELAQQIQMVVLALGERLKVDCHACIGGTDVRVDIDRLRRGVHLVVGTPGRVMEMLEKNHLSSDEMKIFVLDEADEMLRREFKLQIYDVFRKLPSSIQVALFSATMPPPILKMTSQFMRSFTCKWKRMNGSWTLCVTFMRPLTSTRVSFTATPVERLTH